jgi:predicted phage terminase large subunit-like protein
MLSLSGLDRALALRGSLHDAQILFWSHIEGASFVDNWHLEEICEALEDVSACKIRTLVINIPPTCGKSSLANVIWPVWEWLRRPATRYIYASFDQQLVGQRDGGKILALLRSPWWVSTGLPSLLTRTAASASNFDIAGGGFRLAISPGAKGTGRHGNIVVYDDIIKPRDAQGRSVKVSSQALQRVLDWHGNTMSTRQADPATHREVCVMQRLAKDDLAGMFLRRPGTVHVRLPMRHEVSYPNAYDRRTKEGELLFPARFPEDAVTLTEATMTEDVKAAQMQQRPQAAEGSIFRRAYWRFWAPPGAPREEPCLCHNCWGAEQSVHRTGRLCATLPDAGFDLQSWDMAFKGKQTSDFVAGGAWRAAGGNFFLMHLINERIDFARTKGEVLLMATSQPGAERILIEDAANGPAIESELRDTLPGIEMITPEGGKEARASAVTPLFAAHTVYLPDPRTTPLVWALMKQCEAFPKDMHDDMVDMVSQGLAWYRRHGASTLFSAAMTNLRANR